METGCNRQHRMILPDYILSIRSYIFALLPIVLNGTSGLLRSLNLIPPGDSPFHTSYATLTIHLLSIFIIKSNVREYKFGVCWRAYLLGCCLNLGLNLVIFSEDLPYKNFGIYCIAMSFFHWSEYFTQSIFNPGSTEVDSYMLYHSHAYVAAFSLSMVEFWLELYMAPWIKSWYVIGSIGFALVVFGETLRKIAMITARSNFNHYVQDKKDDDHELVTSGVYRLFRHPSYVGWFWWAIGTQFLLCNPLCILAYTLASWRFFSDRIYFEEEMLVKFFGEKYISYQNSVGTGLPFIAGFVPTKDS